MIGKMFLKSIILLISINIILSQALAKEKLAHPQVPRITCEELKQLIDKGIDIVLVDTRHETSFKRGHIRGAINIPDTPIPPLTEKIIEARLTKLPKDKLIVFYCD